MTRPIVYRDLADMVPNPENAKLHEADGIAASITRYGIIDPVVVDDRTGMILGGHGRTEALGQLLAAYEAGEPPPDGIRTVKGRWQIPTLTGWASADDDEATAAGIALNALVERGGWDRAKLADILGAAPDLAALGYTDADVAELMKDSEEWNPDSDGGGNARREASIDELAAEYRNNGIRTLVLDYPLDDYVKVAALADDARKRHNVEGNAELLMALARRWDAEHPESPQEP